MKIRMFTLPNMITLANLACGCAAAALVLGQGRLDAAFWLVIAAAVFDFLDGLAARLTGQQSALGVQLDSLADMVSFGVVPSAALFVMYRDSFPLWNPGPFLASWPGWLMFAVALFSALRLARFNIDGEQVKGFRGMPTPAAALLVVSLGAAIYADHIEVSRELLLCLAAAVCWLMVSPIGMFSLKFEGFGWKANRLRYIFLICCAVLVAVLREGGVAASVVLYAVISAGRHYAPINGKKSGG